MEHVAAYSAAMTVSALFTGGWIPDAGSGTVEVTVSGNINAVLAPGDEVTGVAGGPPSEITATLACEDPTP